MAKALAVHLRVAAGDLAVGAKPLWTNYELLLADLDGVIYQGSKEIVNASASINLIQGQGMKVGYVTNNSSRSQQTIAEQLNDFGLEVKSEDVISSGQTAVELLARLVPAGSKVYVVGGEGLKGFVTKAGFELVADSDAGPIAVIQGFAPEVSWRELSEAAYSIQNGAIWIATNNDWTLPLERGIAPGNGTLVSAVHTAVGQFPKVAGKPEPAIFETALQAFGTRNALYVGDRLETDILGANNTGIDSALVLTGIASKKDVLAARVEERPKIILETLGDLLGEYPELKETKRGWRCNDAEVERLGDKVLVVSGDPSSIDALRAACKVIWSAEKHIHFLDVQPEIYA